MFPRDILNIITSHLDPLELIRFFAKCHLNFNTIFTYDGSSHPSSITAINMLTIFPNLQLKGLHIEINKSNQLNRITTSLLIPITTLIITTTTNPMDINILYKCTNLQTIQLRSPLHNPVPTTNINFSKFPNLHTIKLSFLQITPSILHELSESTNLKILHLSNCHIHPYINNSILSNLRYFKLINNNQLQTLSFLRESPKLKKLHIDNCPKINLKFVHNNLQIITFIRSGTTNNTTLQNVHTLTLGSYTIDTTKLTHLKHLRRLKLKNCILKITQQVPQSIQLKLINCKAKYLIENNHLKHTIVLPS